MNAKKNKLLIWGIIIGIIILAGIIFGIIVYKKDHKVSKIHPPTYYSSINENERLGKSKKDEESDEVLEDLITSDLYKEFEQLPEEKKEETEVVPREEKIPFEKLSEIQKEQEKQEKQEEQKGPKEQKDQKDQKDQKEDPNKIPAKFSLADKINFKVENQQSHGLCWAFSSLNALESYLAIKNLGDYDFSEMHLDYMESNLLYGYREIHSGGNFAIFEDYLRNFGVVLENQVPYRLDNYPESEYKNFINIKKATEVIKTIDFPSFYKNDLNDYTEEQAKEFRDTVKKHIMTNGGLYTIIAAPDRGTKYFNPNTSAQCFKNGSYEDISRGFHAVTIIGWDDNFSKNNFQDMKPDNDGAYIALNSWGSEWGQNGYFYISYEDMYVESDLSGVVSTSIQDAYKLSSISNPVIKDYLELNLKKNFINYNGEDYITPLATSNITSLDISNKGATNLKDIEIFNNLYSLYASDNNITNIDSINNLYNLTYLDLSNNNLNDISALNKLKSKGLYSINLSNNKIKDASPLGNVSLEPYSMIYLSGNKDITGYEKIKTASLLDLSDCNVKDVSNIKDIDGLYNLNIANSPDIKNIELLPKTLTSLTASNCNISSLSPFNTELEFLFLEDNNLTNLDGIENFKYLAYINLSNNKIEDWSNLQNIALEKNPNSDYYIDYDGDYSLEPSLSIVANNCNITDISIFNNIKYLSELYLEDNKITSLENFNPSKTLNCINLSGNKNITNLKNLDGLYLIELNNCNLTDLNELAQIETISILELKDNDIKDISPLSKIPNLYELDLSGNKNLTGSISNDSISNLNLTDCNNSNLENLIKTKNLYSLEIKGNKVNDITKIINSMDSDYVSLSIDEISDNELYSIKKSLYIEEALVKINNVPLVGNNDTIDLNTHSLLSQSNGYTVLNNYEITNGTLNGDYIVSIKDPSLGYVDLKIPYMNRIFSDISYSFNNSTFRLIFDNNKMNNQIENTTNIANITNTTNTTNSIKIENTTTNTIENNISKSNTINQIENTTKKTENTLSNSIQQTNSNTVYNKPQNVVNSNTVENIL